MKKAQAIKLSKADIDQLVSEKEKELAAENERLKFEKSLRTLIRRMEKQGFYIGKVLFAHMEKEETNRWKVSTYRTSH
jgi:hypothetical protein